MFQFPSTGKAYPKYTYTCKCEVAAKAEFQFPSTGKAYPKGRPQPRDWRSPCRRDRFNSLQPGKPIQRVDLNLEIGGVHAEEIVSIPFNRESLSKDYIRAVGGGVGYDLSFNSLQTGKPIQSFSALARMLGRDVFQFPSTGKAYPKIIKTLDPVERALLVSIPFKRESLSKARLRQPCMHKRYVSFNSLQTGKPIQSAPDNEYYGITGGFQFPSNGKAYPKK